MPGKLLKDIYIYYWVLGMLPFFIKTFDKSSNFSKLHFLKFKNGNVNICMSYFMTVDKKHEIIHGIKFKKWLTIDEWRVLLHQRLFFYKYAKVHYIFIMSQNGILRIKEFTSNFNENQREICKKTLYYITV